MFLTFPTKITFPPLDLQTPPFPPISSNTALRKALTYPCTLGSHTPNAAGRFMTRTYPKL